MSEFNSDGPWLGFDWDDFEIPCIQPNFYCEQFSGPSIPATLGPDETPELSSDFISRPSSTDTAEPVVMNSQSLKRKREPSPLEHNARPTKANFEHHEKAKNSQTRMDGVCCRCIARKGKCTFEHPGEPCDSCRNARPREICQMAYFADLDGLIRDGPTTNFAPTLYFRNKAKQGSGSAWKKINAGLRSPKYSLETHIEVSQGQGLGNLKLQVREFALNALKNYRCSQNHKWLDSNSAEHVYTCPPWAISDVSYAQSQVAGFMGNSMDTYLARLIGPPTRSCSLASQIRKLSFEAARKYDRLHEGSLPGLALKFWQACRFIEQFWIITGEETLGMFPDTSSPESPYFQKTPMTPIMDFQLDNIIINHQLRPLMREMRNIIKKKVLTNYKPENDFECYLAMFILLDHVEIAFGHDREWARRHGISDFDGFSNKPLIDALNCGAYTILAMFQRYRGGHYAFTADWAKVVERYRLDDKQHERSKMAKEYFLKVREIMEDRNSRVLESTFYGSPSYWTSQLHSSEFTATRVQS